MRFFITICFLAMTCFANAQSAAMQKEIDRAIALADFSSAMEQTMALQFESRGLTEHLTDPKAMYKELTEAMSEPLKKILTKVYSDNFTLDELKQMNDFYETPVGKKCLTMVPNMLTTSVEMLQNDQATIEKIQQIVMKYFKQ